MVEVGDAGRHGSFCHLTERIIVKKGSVEGCDKASISWSINEQRRLEHQSGLGTGKEPGTCSLQNSDCRSPEEDSG